MDLESERWQLHSATANRPRDLRLERERATPAVARPQTLPSAGQVSAVMPPAQPQIMPQQPSELVSDSPQAFQQQSQHQAAPPPMPFYAYPQMEQAIALLTNPQIANNFFNHVSNIYLQSGLRTEPHIAQQQTAAAATTTTPPTTNTLQHQGSQPHMTPQQQPQPQTGPPPLMPFYPYPQMEQAIALLTNPQIANNFFNHVFNIYLQSGLRAEPHHTHHHPQDHFQHHLHGSQHHHHHLYAAQHHHHHLYGAQHHHHHHHGPNGQGNGQDATMPLDSPAINETKPRGLNRAEIDSLTPYIHMDEKDSKTCVICLSKFELKSKIRPLPCNHAFHAKCVDKWLRANRTCPICRRDALRIYHAKIKKI